MFDTGHHPAHQLGTPADALPLSRVRVLEIGQAVCAPLCARHLADLGAEVIKIESPAGGDLARGYDDVVHGTSAYFTWANYGKKSIILDLRSCEGSTAFLELVEESDVLVHNLGPGAMDRLGFDAETLSARNPRLVNCGISGYGTDGPLKDRKAFDLLVQAECGLLSVTGTPDEPAKVGISVVDMCAAVYALSAIQAALTQRERTGTGTFLDISLFDCISEWMMAPAYHQLYAGRAPRREGAKHNMMVPYGVYRTGPNSSVNFAVQTTQHWQLLCDTVLGRPHLAADPRFATNAARVGDRGVLEPLIEARFAELGHEEVVSRLVECAIPVGEVNDLEAFTQHPQLRDRNRWFPIQVEGGTAQALRAPFNLTTEPPNGKRVPRLGEHTSEVLERLSLRAAADPAPQ